MEWKVLTVLVLISHLTVITHEGPVGGASPALEEDKKARKASVVLCHPEQTFFCVNLTHYSPCIHLDLSNLLNTSLTMSRGNEFYCGAERCCQAGAASPCTYRCQRSTLDFQNPHIPWNFAHLRKKKNKRSRIPLTSEEVDRLNKIVSVKSFIIRQKDLEEWGDDDSDDYENDETGYQWKPSYRTFCPVKRARSSRIITSKSCNATSPNATTGSPQTTKRHIANITTTYTTRKTTTTKATTSTTSTTNPTTTTKKTTTTTKPTTTTKKTHKTTTHRQTTTTKRTTPKRTPKTITKKPTTKRVTKRHNKANKHLTTKITTTLPCTASLLRRKLPIPGTCEDYLECTIKLKTRTKKIIYEWKIKSCKHFMFFSVKHQECRKMETVSCKVNNDRKKRFHDKFDDDY